MALNLLVTGGAGFIGAHLVQRLLDRKDCARVVALDNLLRGSWNSLDSIRNDPRLETVTGDIRDYEQILAASRGMDVVFHLAAQATVMGADKDMEYAFQANVTGTFNVLRAARESGTKVVFSSSREVYGEPESLPVTETAPLAPKNAYGASKMAAEAWCRAFAAQGLEVSILRLSNIYGPGDSGRVIPIFIENVTKGQTLTIYGGEQTIDFLPVSTACKALISAATVSHSEPINVGGGKGATLQELAGRICSLAGARDRIELLPGRCVETKKFVADVTRMKKILGVAPPKDPLEELPEMMELALACA